MIHSLCPFQSPDGIDYVLYWIDLVPQALNLSNHVVVTPAVNGAPVTSSDRWNYALGRTGFLYACNGSDKKFFDGLVWREYGLPALTEAEVEGITFSLGTAGLSDAQVGAVTLAMGGASAPYLTGASPTTCVDLNFWNMPHDMNGAFGYFNAADPNIGSSPAVPAAAHTTTGDSLMFNPRSMNQHPLEMTNYDGSGVNDGTYPHPWPAMPTQFWLMAAASTLVIPAEGNYTMLVEHDDGFFFGIDSSAALISGPTVDGFIHTITALNSYPVIGANNVSGHATDTFIIYFPAAGNYNIEFNYAQWYTGQRLTVKIDNSEVRNVVPITPGSSTADSIGRDVYCVLFDEDADVSADPDVALSPPAFLGRVIFPAGEQLLVTGLPDFTGTSVPPAVATKHLDKLIAMTGDGDVTSRFAVDHNLGCVSVTGSPGSSTVTTSGSGADVAAGDIVGFAGTGDPTLDGNLYQAQSVPGAHQFTIKSIPGVQTGLVVTGTVSVLYRATFDQTSMPPINNLLFFGGSSVDTTGEIGIAGSTVDTADRGYQFYACIYNPLTGHIGNRIAIGNRVIPTGRTSITLGNLPQVTLRDPEWQLLIGRTGDGGEVPYAIMHANGEWLTTDQTTLKITASQIDGAAELPINNDEPPAFNLLWREGDRICGVKFAAGLRATVWRSGSEADAMTGDFMGDPGQAWSPSKIETFPTAQAIVGGFGYDGSSWVYTANDFAELSELTGETLWNGPWNAGIAGAHAFTRGWKNLPFWLSQDKQLMVMMPNADQTEGIPISNEYEAALLSKIADPYLSFTEVLYFRAPEKQLDLLRIKGLDLFRRPFTIIHDFNLRDERSPYGQGYEEVFAGELAQDFTHEIVRDGNGHQRVWAGDTLDQLYQLYDGDNDNSNEFTADALALVYIGPNRTAVQFVDYYGDENVEWFVADQLNAQPNPLLMEDLSENVQLVPGQDSDSHYQISLNRPELIHAYLWFRLESHSADGTTALNDPPHMPVETYGRVLMVSPLMGTTAGR
jgi:hypothetical protein